MELKRKFNEKTHKATLTLQFDDYADIFQQSMIDNVTLVFIQNEIINILIEIFIRIIADSRHIESYDRQYNTQTREYTLSFHFKRFSEVVDIVWGTNASLIEIKLRSSMTDRKTGYIAILARATAPPYVNDLHDSPSTLSNILFKHIKRELSQYHPNIK